MSRFKGLPPALQGAIRWGLALLLLGLVGYQLAMQWGKLGDQPITVSWPWVGASALGLALFLTLSAEGWRRLVCGLDERLSFKDAFRILFYSNLGEYLPGGVWNMVGRVALAQRVGVPPLKTSATLLMEVACQVTAAILVALLTFPAFAGQGMLANPLLLAGAAIAVIIGMHPRILNAVLALGERLTKKTLPRFPFSYRFILGMLAYYTLNWLILGASFAALGQALLATPLTPGQLGLLVGSFAVAWNVGVFAFFFPAGLGVREVALITLLASAFPPAWPAVLALVARVWILAGEALAFGVAMLLKGPEAQAAWTEQRVPEAPSVAAGAPEA
ncbi:MAG: lysylphosphatidylglycerol synthase domain-containing protein [Candidatus Sericytochromatia bacterium]